MTRPAATRSATHNREPGRFVHAVVVEVEGPIVVGRDGERVSAIGECVGANEVLVVTAGLRRHDPDHARGEDRHTPRKVPWTGVVREVLIDRDVTKVKAGKSMM